jgi:hypothetical protein
MEQYRRIRWSRRQSVLWLDYTRDRGQHISQAKHGEATAVWLRVGQCTWGIHADMNKERRRVFEGIEKGELQPGGGRIVQV